MSETELLLEPEQELEEEGPIQSGTGWGELVLGALPVLTLGLGVLMLSFRSLVAAVGTTVLFLAFLTLGAVIPAVAFAAGWTRSFPRWAYANLGMAVAFSALWWSNVTTPPQITVFNALFDNTQPWGWHAWIVLILAAFVALVVSLVTTRSLQPTASFFVNIWRDWTRLSFLIYSGLGLLVFMNYDPSMGTMVPVFLGLSVLALVGGALLYTRSLSKLNGALSLAAGLLLGMASNIAIVVVFYMGQAKLAGQTIPAAAWQSLALQSLLFVGRFMGYMLAPIVIGGIYWGVRRFILRKSSDVDAELDDMEEDQETGKVDEAAPLAVAKTTAEEPGDIEVPPDGSMPAEGNTVGAEE